MQECDAAQSTPDPGSDFILDLGPEGGVRGGEVVAQGTPEEVVKEPRSYTGHYLAPLLDRATDRAPAQAVSSTRKKKAAAK